MSNKSSKNKEFVVTFDADAIIQAILGSKTPIDTTMSKKERLTYYAYIRIMAELGWPAYNDGDVDFHERIVELVENERFDELEASIYDHYDAVYIKDLQELLEDIPLINKERLPVLKEAFMLYNLGYYYGSVTLLISQIVGIVKDIAAELWGKGMEFDDDHLRLLNTRYDLDIKEDNLKKHKLNEKAKALLALLEGHKYNDEEREYLYLIGYFRCKLFCDKLNDEDILHHANRNMIFHGEQISFGSKEQALKLILCVDALCCVAYVIHEELISEE